MGKYGGGWDGGNIYNQEELTFMRIFCLQTGEYKDASKNVRMYLRHSSNVIVDLWYMILNHFGVNHFISIVSLDDYGPTDGPADQPMDGRTDIAC